MSDKTRNTIKYLKMAVFAFIVAFMFVCGSYLDTEFTLDVKKIVSFKSPFIWCVIIVFVLEVGISFLIEFLNKKKIFSKKIPSLPKWTVCFPVITWVISWLAIFPGVFSYDCYEEWQMVANGNLTSHHPVLHVLSLGGLTEISCKFFGNGNAGIALYVGIQIAVFTFVYLRLSDYLKKYQSSVSEWVAIILYTLSPVILMFVVATTKDSIFAAFELWFIINCLRLEKNEKFEKSSHIVEFIISALGTMILRKNGLYVVILVMIYLAMVNFKKEKKVLITCAVLAGVYLIYTVPFYGLLNVGKTSSAEMFAVPIQQLARVYRFEKESFSQEELQTLHQVIPEDYWILYIPTTVDSVKNGFDNEGFSENKKEFFTIWIKQGIKNPMTYINAFLANTSDFWYPLAVNDGYGWLYAMDEDNNSNFFDYRVAPPGEKITLINPVYNLFKYLSTDKKITTGVFSILLNSGWYILAWIASLLFVKKEKKQPVFHIIMALSLLSVLAGPMALIRYVLIFYLVLPLETK